MGTVYRRGKQLWIAYRDAGGDRTWSPTGFAVGEEDRARLLLAKVEQQARAARWLGTAPGTPITVKAFVKGWLKRREALANYRTEEHRIRLHVLPHLGSMLIADVRPRHIIEALRQVRERGKLAPRTLHNVYGLMHVLFRDAAIEELIPSNPCILTKAQLGKKEDKNPEWRAGAVFTRDELETLISSTDLPAGGRLLYALGGLAGLRIGEIAGLRWRHYDPDAGPLGRLMIAHSHDREGTKTGRSREVPVHPTLAALLGEWKLRGWAEAFGRHPLPDDLVSPSPKGAMRTGQRAWEQLQGNLEELGYRRRRFHDLRRTFITLARVDGARGDLLEMVTHGPRGNILDIYTSMPWPSLCAEVAKLQVERRMGEVVALPRAAQAGERTGSRVTAGVTVSRKASAATLSRVGGEGFEALGNLTGRRA